jgi:hypothetical protein
LITARLPCESVQQKKKVAGEQPTGVVGSNHIARNRGYGDPRINSARCIGRDLNLRPSQILSCRTHDAVQIGFLERIRVEQNEAAHAEVRQLLGHNRTHSSEPHDSDRKQRERRLALTAQGAHAAIKLLR